MYNYNIAQKQDITCLVKIHGKTTAADSLSQNWSILYGIVNPLIEIDSTQYKSEVVFHWSFTERIHTHIYKGSTILYRIIFFFWFWRYLTRGAYMTFKSIFHKTLNLF